MVTRPRRTVRAPLDPQVLIPYSQLIGLLEASEKLESIEDDVKYIRRTQEQLRSQFTELMIAFGDLKRFVSD